MLVLILVGFKVFRAVIMNNMVFWVITRCNSEELRRFGGIYHLQVTSVSQNQQKQGVNFLLL
jgi:hypothetical protein